MRVLFADNEPKFLSARTELLRQWGYDVVPLPSETAIREFLRVSSQEIDLGLFDMRMEEPESGLNLVRLLSEGAPCVPSVVLTAYPDIDDAARCMESLAFTYVKKTAPHREQRAALRRASTNRITRLREQLDRSLFEWWSREGRAIWKNLLTERFDAAREEAEALTTLVEDVFTSRMRLVPLGALPSCPVRLAGELLPSCSSPVTSPVTVTTLEASPQVAGVRVLCGQVLLDNGSAVPAGLPDMTPVLMYLRRNGLRNEEGVTATCYVNGDFAGLEIRADHFVLADPALRHLNNLFAGLTTCTQEDVRLVIFALELTALCAKASFRTEHGTTIMTTEMLREPPKEPELASV